MDGAHRQYLVTGSIFVLRSNHDLSGLGRTEVLRRLGGKISSLSRTTPASTRQKCSVCGPAGRLPSGAEARLATVGNYMILFRIRQNTVRIERVVHGSRDLVTVLGGTEN